MHIAVAAALCALALAALCACGARADVTGAPLDVVARREGARAVVAESVVCMAQRTPGDATAVYVSSAGIGVLSVADYARERVDPLIVAARAFRPWRAVTEHPVVPTQACHFDRNGTRFYVWLRLDAATNTFGVLGFEVREHAHALVHAYTIDVVLRSTPVSLNGYARGVGGAPVELRVGAHAWRRSTLLAATGAVVCPASGNTTLLLEYALAGDTTHVYAPAAHLYAGPFALPMQNSSTASLDVLPGDGTVVLGLGGFAPLAPPLGPLLYYEPLFVVIDAAFTSVTPLIFWASPLGATTYGAVTTPTCVNTRWNAITASLTIAIGTGPTGVALEQLLLELFIAFDQASGAPTAGGITLVGLASGPAHAGTCVWDGAESSLVRFVHTLEACVPVRLSMPAGVDAASDSFVYDVSTHFMNDVRAHADLHLNASEHDAAVAAAALHALRMQNATRTILAAPALLSVELPALHAAWHGEARTREAPPLEALTEREARDVPGERHARVLGGAPASIGDAPYACHLVTPTAFCGCTMLDAYTAVTAAHCLPVGALTVDTTLVAPYYVVTGTASLFNADGLGTVSTARRSATHPSALFSGSPESLDIGVVRLDVPLALSPTQRTVAYARSSAASRVGTRVVVHGWGVTQDGNSTLPSRLQRYSGTVAEPAIEGTYRLFRTLGDAPVGGGAGVQHPCFGDSGSGVLVEGAGADGAPLLVGTVSYGTSPLCGASADYSPDVSGAAAWLDAMLALPSTEEALARAFPASYPRQFGAPGNHSGRVARWSDGSESDTFLVSRDAPLNVHVLSAFTLDYDEGVVSALGGAQSTADISTLEGALLGAALGALALVLTFLAFWSGTRAAHAKLR